MLDGIIVGIASTVAAAVVIGAGAVVKTVWHTPKRLDRVERLLPVMLRAVLVLLRCHKAGKCNGELDESIAELETTLSEGAVSQKAHA